MNNLDITILVVSIISFVFGMLFMFIIGTCFSSYCDAKKRDFKYPSYEEKTYKYDNPVPYHPPITNSNLKSGKLIIPQNLRNYFLLYIVFFYLKNNDYIVNSKLRCRKFNILTLY